MPELPDAKRERFLSQYGLPYEDVLVLTETPELANYYESVVKAECNPVRASNWIRTDVMRVLKEQNQDITSAPIAPDVLAQLIRLVDDKKISTTAAKDVFEKIVQNKITLEEAIKVCGVQIGAVEGDKLAGIISAVANANQDVVEVIRSGQDKKDKKLKFLMGLVMKESRGQAKPDEVLKALSENNKKN